MQLLKEYPKCKGHPHKAKADTKKRARELSLQILHKGTRNL